MQVGELLIDIDQMRATWALAEKYFCEALRLCASTVKKR
jgi:hypothetical protein